MKILVTGAAGFVGMHTAERLLGAGHDVVGIDNFNDYYEVKLKRDRYARLVTHPKFAGHELDLCDGAGMSKLFSSGGFDRVIHLAAQAGVRYSLKNPQAYAQSNLVGFINILEGCRHHKVPHLVYASSSSVYGGNTKLPFSTSDSVDHPVSLYAATKRANELMAHTYSHLFALPTTGLRFFTVYGPWGRPDMSPFLFTKAILAGQTIDVFNHGNMQRDFTYVDDIVEGVVRVMDHIPQPDKTFDMNHPNPAMSYAPYRIYNIGNHEPVPLMTFIEALERAIGVTAQKRFLPMQPGDVVATYAETEDLRRDVGFAPNTSLVDGIAKFVSWYRGYYGV